MLWVQNTPAFDVRYVEHSKGCAGHLRARAPIPLHGAAHLAGEEHSTLSPAHFQCLTTKRHTKVSPPFQNRA